LFLCGKWHSPSITADEFRRRLGDELNKYGSRAEEAEKNGGIDWKAISHAVRAIRQSREILTTGGLVFPLACAEELIRIKTGSCGWEEAEDMILRELDELRAVCEASPHASPADMEAARAAVLACYELQPVIG
ncbi:MAG: hypothetical protein J5861_06060, partial [Desulfovibrio sp.]|nr:hypothetical protein [Desulfovibrio sp.]